MRDRPEPSNWEVLRRHPMPAGDSMTFGEGRFKRSATSVPVAKRPRPLQTAGDKRRLKSIVYFPACQWTKPWVRIRIAMRQFKFAFVQEPLREHRDGVLSAGVSRVLGTRILDGGGHPTVWCQQYDPLTLEPSPGRQFEPVCPAPISSRSRRLAGVLHLWCCAARKVQGSSVS